MPWVWVLVVSVAMLWVPMLHARPTALLAYEVAVTVAVPFTPGDPKILSVDIGYPTPPWEGAAASSGWVDPWSDGSGESGDNAVLEGAALDYQVMAVVHPELPASDPGSGASGDALDDDDNALKHKFEAAPQHAKPCSAWPASYKSSTAPLINGQMHAFKLLVPWGLYTVAWIIVAQSVSRLLSSPKEGDIPEHTTTATPPQDILYFFAITIAVFTSFGLVHLVAWFHPTRHDYERWYVALSLISKVTLHLFIFVTLYAQAQMEDGDYDGATRAYRSGYAGASAVVVLTAVAFYLFSRAHKNDPPGKLDPLPCSISCCGPPIPLRWLDYLITAPLMYAVLSVTWGQYNLRLLNVGALLMATTIVIGALMEPVEARKSATLPLTRAKLHTACAVVHAVSAVAFAIAIASAKTGGTERLYPDTWKRTRHTWYFNCTRGEENRHAGMAVCGNTRSKFDHLVVDKEGATVTFYTAVAAIMFAVVSAVLHAVSAWSARNDVKA
eukprot:gene6843-4292_t